MKSTYTGNLFLVGFMGCGKSTIAPLLAEKLKRPLFDTDEWVVNDTGMSISEIFANYGEKWFREKETGCLKIAAAMQDSVVSVGGGAILNSQNFILLKKSGIIIYLKCAPEEILNRVRNDKNRPLLANVPEQDKLEKIRQLLTQRETYYQMSDIIVNVKNDESVQHVTKRIFSRVEDLI